jgi:signal peptidase I
MMPLLLITAAVAVAGLAGLLRLRQTFVLVTIEGSSMRPLFNTGDRVLVRRAELHEIDREQVVVLQPPASGPPCVGVGPTWMIKRAVALPGDTVPDEFLAAVDGERGTVVPDGTLLVLGDNSGSSVDSRAFGYVASERVLGIALRRVGNFLER